MFRYKHELYTLYSENKRNNNNNKQKAADILRSYSITALAEYN